jgi:hypothetical protein
MRGLGLELDDALVGCGGMVGDRVLLVGEPADVVDLLHELTLELGDAHPRRGQFVGEVGLGNLVAAAALLRLVEVVAQPFDLGLMGGVAPAKIGEFAAQRLVA